MYEEQFKKIRESSTKFSIDNGQLMVSTFSYRFVLFPGALGDHRRLVGAGREPRGVEMHTLW